MRRRALAVAVAAAMVAALGSVPGASGHSRSLVATESFDQGGQRGVYRWYTMLVPAKHTHIVRCARKTASYPERVLLNRRDVTRHHVVLDDQEEEESPPTFPDHSDDNEIGVTFEGRGVHIEITAPNWRRVRDPSDFADSGPRYGNVFRIHSNGTRGAYLRFLCYQRFTG